MNDCKHQRLVLLTPKGEKLRCRHCDLTLDKEELTTDFCPECYEVNGVKRSDFEEIGTKDDGIERYSCEECGLIITS